MELYLAWISYHREERGQETGKRPKEEREREGPRMGLRNT